jgi:hypothetical protein
VRPPEEVTACWKALACLSDLTTGRRFATKVQMSPEAVSRRLHQVEELRQACLAFARLRTPEKGSAEKGSATVLKVKGDDGGF